MASEKKSNPWIGIGVAVAIVGVAGVLWSARNHGEDLYERDQLAITLAATGGNQVCALAAHKARPAQMSGLRVDGYAPEVELIGPPRILSCGLVDSDRQEKDRLKFFQRCRDVDLACVEIID